MAKVELGPIVQSVRGSIGGVAFRRIGARFYVSPKSPGPVRAGTGSAAQHELLREATGAWSALTAAVKEFWARYHAAEHPTNPRTGRLFTSPYHLFVWYQMARLHTGAAMLTATTPPVPFVAHGRVMWQGPFNPGGHPYDGQMWLDRGESEFMQYMALFIAYSPDGARPSKFPKKLFPTADYGPGYILLNSSGLVWRALGYPPGLVLEDAAAPMAYKHYLLSGWGLHNNVVWSCPWTPSESPGLTITLPSPAPIVYF